MQRISSTCIPYLLVRLFLDLFTLAALGAFFWVFEAFCAYLYGPLDWGRVKELSPFVSLSCLLLLWIWNVVEPQTKENRRRLF